MVMMIEPLRKAISAARDWAGQEARVVYLSPQGQVLDQSAVNRFATQQSLILIAGRYEGIDERLIELEVDEEWSIGDYVLSGGELPAMVLMDASNTPDTRSAGAFRFCGSGFFCRWAAGLPALYAAR